MSAVQDWSDLGERVRESRLAVGLTQAQLAARIGLERSMLAKVERGDRRLDALELYRLADALGLPIAHFVLEAPAALVSQRTLLTEDTDTPATRSGYLLQALLQEWLRDVEQLVALDVLQVKPIYRAVARDIGAAVEVAHEVRGRLGVSPTEPLGAMASVCDQLGLLVLPVSADGDGASVLGASGAVAVVSTKGDPGRRRATAAHELGHQVLGDEYSTDVGVHASRDDRERIVDSFAAELLVPTAALEVRVHSGFSADELRATLVDAAATFRASWTLVLRQAYRCRLLDDSQVRHWSSQKPTRAELLECTGMEPQPDMGLGTVPPSFSRAVLTAYRQSRISTARAIELLRDSIGEADLPPRRSGAETR